MSIDEELEYLSEWKREERRLQKIRDEWALWANVPVSPSALLTR
jgi:hypothetical protein